ncbi:UNVERIFIED_CONTAM: hypothetical protein RMT77_006869 [Armadillidium vulgare]
MKKVLAGGLFLCLLMVPSFQREPLPRSIFLGTITQPFSPSYSWNSNEAVDPSAGCRYWCKNQRSQFYCCEYDDQRLGPVGEKWGYCPPLRPSCPGLTRSARPRICSNDYSCPGVDKCCFDVCLEVSVCKAPLR